jgi:hypothetical protein
VDGGYHMFAQRYKEILARDGVTVDLRISAGSQENVSRLLEESSDVEVGFFQGGSAFSANAPDRSLRALYYEPRCSTAGPKSGNWTACGAGSSPSVRRKAARGRWRCRCWR